MLTQQAIADMQNLRTGMARLRLIIAANCDAIAAWGGRPGHAIETRLAKQRIERARGELAVLVTEAESIMAMHEENDNADDS